MISLFSEWGQCNHALGFQFFHTIGEVRRKLVYLKSLGLFGLIVGVLGQMIGLFSAFTAIERAMDVSPPILMGGLKVSMITPMYGMVILLISYLLRLVLDYLASLQSSAEDK